jgi:hypothetical protein
MLFNCYSWYSQVRVSFFFYLIYSTYLLLISFFSSPFPLSSQSIDTCIQTRRARAILLVKLDLCWTHMVQHTFEMMGSHLFLFFISFFFSIYLRFFFRFYSLFLSLSLLRFTSCYFVESNPSIANVVIILNASIIHIILKKHCLKY